MTTMMMMMEGIERAAAAVNGNNINNNNNNNNTHHHHREELPHSSPQYTTPPKIQSSSPSTQLTSNSNLFFPSSASHTLHPAIATAPTTSNHDHKNDDQDSPSSQENEHDDQEEEANNSAENLTDADLNEIVANPWTESSKREFYAKFNLSNPSYKNKLRLSPEAEERVRYFLLNPNSPLDPNSPTDARLKARSKSFALHPYHPTGSLYRNDSTTLRRHVSEAEVWDLLTSEHVKSGHKGRDRMLTLIKERFIGYTLEELMFVLGSCRVCSRARQGSSSGGGGSGGIGNELAHRVRLSLGVQQAQQARDMQAHKQHQMQLEVQRQALVAAAIPPAHRFTLSSSAANAGVGHVPGVRPTPPAFAQVARNRPSPQQLLQAQRMGNKILVFNTAAQDPNKTSLYALNESGLVSYDVPDWYH